MVKVGITMVKPSDEKASSGSFEKWS